MAADEFATEAQCERCGRTVPTIAVELKGELSSGQGDSPLRKGTFVRLCIYCTWKAYDETVIPDQPQQCWNCDENVAGAEVACKACSLCVDCSQLAEYCKDHAESLFGSSGCDETHGCNNCGSDISAWCDDCIDSESKHASELHADCLNCQSCIEDGLRGVCEPCHSRAVAGAKDQAAGIAGVRSDDGAIEYADGTRVVFHDD